MYYLLVLFSFIAHKFLLAIHMIAIPDTYVRKYVSDFSKIGALVIDLPKGNFENILGLVIVMQTSRL